MVIGNCIIPATIDKVVESMIFLKIDKNFRMLQDILEHELKHLEIPYLKCFCFKGGFSLNYILEEGNAEKKPLVTDKNFQQQLFLYNYKDNGQTYSLYIPQIGKIFGYVINTLIYFQIKTILSKKEFNSLLSLTENDSIDDIIQKIYNITGDKVLSKRYVKEAINSIEIFFYENCRKQHLLNEACIDEFMRQGQTIDELEKIIKQLTKNKKDLLDLEIRTKINTYTIFYNNTLYLKRHPEKIREMKQWNEELEEFRKTHTSFEDNFIELQKTFLKVMCRKVEKATSVEEVYQILEDLKYIKPAMPTIRNAKGEDVTNSQIGMLSLKYVVSNKIAQLQEKANCSIMPNKNKQTIDGVTPHSGGGR